MEDNKALLYLPIAPEVEDPEENPFGPPPDASAQTGAPEDVSTGGDKKQRQPSSEGGPAKKKARTTTIELQGVPSDGETRTEGWFPRPDGGLTAVSSLFSELHPLLGVKGDSKSKKKTAGRPKGSKGKDKDFSFKPKPYRRDRPSFPVAPEALGSTGLGGGGGVMGAGGGGMKGRAEGALTTGKNTPAAAECGSAGALLVWFPNTHPALLPAPPP